MVSSWLLCAAIVAASPTSEGASPEDLAAYEAARSQVGRDSDAHVKLALWCEAHGMPAERTRHLAIAVVTDPKNAAARGLLGLVAYRGQWQRPDAVIEKVRADAELSVVMAEYNARRDKMAKTADGQWDLALWCEKKGLKPEAMAHLASVVRLDPARDGAWKRLGYRKVGRRWVTEEQLAAERGEAEAQTQANKRWQPLLTKWRGWLGKENHRAEAERALAEVADPRAVPSVWAVFAGEGASLQLVAVQVLGQIDAPASSRALALLVAGTKSSKVRQIASETLRRRDPRDYVGFLLSLLRDPLGYRTGLVLGPDGFMHRVLRVGGKNADVVAVYGRPVMGPGIPFDPSVLPRRLFTNDVAFDPYGVQYGAMLNGPFLDQAGAQTLQSMMVNPQHAPEVLAHHQGKGDAGVHSQALPTSATAADVLVRNATAAARFRDFQIAQFANSTSDSPRFQEAVGLLEMANVSGNEASVRRANSQVFAALNMITGQNLPEDREPWKKWWYDVQGYAYTPPESTEKIKPTYFMSMPSCFGAGTLVKSMDGPKPIERIRVGDQVLTQDVKGGALTFRAVTAVHHNPPGETLRVEIGGEAIVPSVFHRFWKVGQGWVMARDLKPGDSLRMLDGPATVESVRPAGTQPVFNLDVAEDHDFFVGTRGALVHDNTLPELRLVPFDAEPSLTTLAREGLHRGNHGQER